MNDIGKLDSVLNEEDRNIISNKIAVTLVSIKLYCETTYISDCISTATRARDRREADEDWRYSRSIGKNTSIRDIL